MYLWVWARLGIKKTGLYVGKSHGEGQVGTISCKISWIENFQKWNFQKIKLSEDP